MVPPPACGDSRLSSVSSPFSTKSACSSENNASEHRADTRRSRRGIRTVCYAMMAALWAAISIMAPAAAQTAHFSWAQVTPSSLTQTYTGAPLAATVTTTTNRVAASLSYNGAMTAPTSA